MRLKSHQNKQNVRLQIPFNIIDLLCLHDFSQFKITKKLVLKIMRKGKTLSHLNHF